MWNEKTTLERKKNDKRVKTSDTVLAPDKRAIVLIEETVKIFSVRNSEYKPSAYKVVIPILVNILAGTKR
jgi:hypothetical protein